MRVFNKVRKLSGTTVILLLTIMLALTGCNASQKNTEAEKKEQTTAEAKGRTITHEMGETELKNTPQKIVTLELSFVDALNALGITPVGIADDNKPEMIAKLVGSEIEYTSLGTREQPSLELISSLQPDLIIADAERHSGIYEDLKKIAPTIVLKSRESTYEENLDSFKTIAEAANLKAAGEKRLSQHKKTIEELKSSLSVDEQMTILPAVVRDTSFQAHTSSSYDGELLKHIGLQVAIEDQTQPYAEMNLEQLVEIDPDVLLLANNEGKLLTDEWKENPLWKNLKAVKNNQVYSIDRDLWTRFRGVESAEIMAKDTLNMLNGK
ncbi:ABC transporter substrate-binding protein [Metabacillus bambusae]|uniref:ABC transporter substrate-binding protein n=1 Tax=Metabacillus bambusae TaxID=2795218 RepID=A0ABS3N9H2_9BACI|nr:Fe(3+) dicitrate ABC transporter substrate-binding protein [Metabacillus bambusae]MBO1514924.1 ABC transporter substrate-binding protein [Metabacillus bambusae]